MAIFHRIAKLEQHAARVRPPTCGCKDGGKMRVIQSPAFKTMGEIRAHEAMQPQTKTCPVCGRFTHIVLKSQVDASSQLTRAPLPATGT